MLQFLKLKTIKKWIHDYKRNKTLPNETESITIDLEKIEAFVKKVKDINDTITADNKKINAVRFYLTRQNNIRDNVDDNNLNIQNATVGDRRNTLFYDKNFEPQTQISLLALPVINYSLKPMPDNDYINALLKHRGRTEAKNRYHWWSGKDFIENDDAVLCLYARNSISEHTGLCPYNCDETMPTP